MRDGMPITGLLERTAQELFAPIQRSQEPRRVFQASPVRLDEEPRTTAAGEARSTARGAFYLLAQSESGPAAQGARLRIGEGLTSLGSHPENSEPVDDPCVSRFHCRLHLREDGRLWVRDLGSRNGTFVDGLRVTEAELLPGAVLRLGGRTFRIESGERVREGELPGFVTLDAALRERLKLLERVAKTRIPVLLQGESGTGKEVAARALHERSPRNRGPFVAINCGAICAELAEAELFGHERGAFTGAVSSSPGAFGAADGGTLFLDEIGDLPLGLQVKLLRALESAEVKPVGAARPRSIDVRIVSATCRDLRRMVAEGSFREDLFFRLRGLAVELSPLRERVVDVLPLAEHFLAAEPDAAGVSLSTDARAALLAHSWPGNARELRHAIRLGAALCQGGTLRARDLQLEEPLTAEPQRQRPDAPAQVQHRQGPRAPEHEPDSEPSGQVSLRGRSLAELEALAIRSSYQRNAGARRSICAELGIARSSLLRKLSALGLRAGCDGSGEPGEEDAAQAV